MPIFNITLKKDAPPEELEKAKSQVVEGGGVIKHEYTLIKGFTAEFPADNIQTLESSEHVHVEQDAEFKTQV
ncbi:hypothetical protein BDW42DRAFT_164426 [Aspergillus taichungensis]|uniref:Inhibitor I9 domain-containing protein n=1 Tax=Aspergillus taichungensis TaxID=482145 RepID=A0A2J5I1I8_9EURO|nr:hypothetical protein BDW42DRAFT_164426 [Aspergillus taichungensis]